MVKIPLEEWAALHGASLRTAQNWALDEAIPAKLVTKVVTMKRKMKKYVIDRDARSPKDSK